MQLQGQRISVGRATSNDLVVDDPAVSALHAAFERYSGGWCIRDLGSSNGTYVNGNRVVGEQLLRPSDQIQAGKSRLVFRVSGAYETQTTDVAEDAPDLTRRERAVLVALCRPMLGGEAFNAPASVRQMAAELVVTEAAVKNHLLNLYDKFGVYDQGESRRVRLANEAVRRRAVSVADLSSW
jgi:hypothetical protein